MAYQYFEKLTISEKSRYQLKCDFIGPNDCPYRQPADRLVDDPSKWPDIHFGDIYTYLIDTPSVHSWESMKNYRSLEGYRYFECRFVQTTYSIIFYRSVANEVIGFGKYCQRFTWTQISPVKIYSFDRCQPLLESFRASISILMFKGRSFFILHQTIIMAMNDKATYRRYPENTLVISWYDIVCFHRLMFWLPWSVKFNKKALVKHPDARPNL